MRATSVGCGLSSGRRSATATTGVTVKLLTGIHCISSTPSDPDAGLRRSRPTSSAASRSAVATRSASPGSARPPGNETSPLVVPAAVDPLGQDQPWRRRPRRARRARAPRPDRADASSRASGAGRRASPSREHRDQRLRAPGQRVGQRLEAADRLLEAHAGGRSLTSSPPFGPWSLVGRREVERAAAPGPTGSGRRRGRARASRRSDASATTSPSPWRTPASRRRGPRRR